ncbi:hypothetical protein H2200_000361 [Cladophialophora chaetospira]|uniref:Uncharacterized protein n=1 Tax=Cladophialophora chaetospira TaxID=386627 RepID=A0AA38XND9_9EURO|nr:hypothetical protein H2200_000361 [Cladophialophora chaetospira]
MGANDPILRRTLTRLRGDALTPDAVKLVERVTQLEKRFKRVLRPVNPDLTGELQGVLAECFSITTCDGAVPFRTTLKKAGLNPHEWFNNKLIMQIDKLAAYHRIPTTLAKEVYRKATRALFSSISVEYLDPYKPSQSAVSLTGKKLYHHYGSSARAKRHAFYAIFSSSNTAASLFQLGMDVSMTSGLSQILQRTGPKTLLFSEQ